METAKDHKEEQVEEDDATVLREDVVKVGVQTPRLPLYNKQDGDCYTEAQCQTMVMCGDKQTLGRSMHFMSCSHVPVLNAGLSASEAATSSKVHSGDDGPAPSSGRHDPEDSHSSQQTLAAICQRGHTCISHRTLQSLPTPSLWHMLLYRSLGVHVCWTLFLLSV